MEITLSKEDVRELLDLQNSEMVELLKERAELDPDTDRYKEIQKKLDYQTGQTTALTTLYYYLDGKKDFEETKDLLGG